MWGFFKFVKCKVLWIKKFIEFFWLSKIEDGFVFVIFCDGVYEVLYCVCFKGKDFFCFGVNFLSINIKVNGLIKILVYGNFFIY